MWLSLLISHVRKRYSQGQTLQQGSAKVAAVETEGILVQIGLEIFFFDRPRKVPRINAFGESRNRDRRVCVHG